MAYNPALDALRVLRLQAAQRDLTPPEAATLAFIDAHGRLPLYDELTAILAA